MLAHGQVVGLVTMADIGQAVNRASPRAGTDARPGIQAGAGEPAGR